jgi:hypothetical protein
MRIKIGGNQQQLEAMMADKTVPTFATSSTRPEPAWPEPARPEPAWPEPA